MKCNRKKYTLNEVCSRIYSGGTPSTRHPEYWNGDLKWLSSGETSQRFIYDTERTITQEGVDNSSTKLANKGCTVVATAGQGYTRGQASFLMIDTYMNQSVIACEANAEYILPLYLYYNLDSRYEEFRLLSDGTSTRGGLSGWILKRMEIELPPIEEQRKIVSILGGIDRKIEINNRINRNLEEQAKAIYQNIAKKSEVEAPLSNFISIKHGYAFKGDFIQQDDNNVVLVTPGNFKIGGGFQESKCKYFSAEYPQDFVLPSGTLVVTMTDLSKDADTLGYGAIIPQNPQRIYLHNQRIGRVEELNDILPKDYIYWYMRSYKYHHQIVGSASGSTVKHTSPKRILEQLIPIPNREAMSV